MEDGIGKYPNGFRHYESFANYKLVNPNAEISEYISEVNQQVEFHEFLAINRQAAIEESESSDWKFDHPDEEDEQELPVKEMVMTPLFEKDCRGIYERKIQEALLNKKWYTLIDALDDTIDMWGYGRNMYDYPVQNSYVPVRHTIMPKPNLTDNDDIGFRFNLSGESLRINPVA